MSTPATASKERSIKKIASMVHSQLTTNTRRIRRTTAAETSKKRIQSVPDTEYRTFQRTIKETSKEINI